MLRLSRIAPIGSFDTRPFGPGNIWCIAFPGGYALTWERSQKCSGGSAMTRTPFLRVLDTAAAVRFATAAIGALALVPPSRPTAVAAPAAAGEADHPLARTSPHHEVGRTSSAERGSSNRTSDVAAHRVGPVLSGGGPASGPDRSATPLSGWTFGRSRPARQSLDGLRDRTPTTSVDDLDPNSSAGPGATAAFGLDTSGAADQARRTR
jgi:hypothetical protein